jgi:hypothetical protein
MWYSDKIILDGFIICFEYSVKLFDSCSNIISVKNCLTLTADLRNNWMTPGVLKTL